MVERKSINPWAWSQNFGFNQAELVEGGSKVLFCSGQTSVDGEGVPQHAGDMAAQIALAADNLEAVLREAGMDFGNLVRLNFYTTDVDAFMANAEALGPGPGRPESRRREPCSGVARLAFPELMIEIEATAVA